MNDSIIIFNNFGFQYNSQSSPTLYDINLSIKKGEKVLIAGPSGCGKSTLVHCINGLIPFSYKGEATGSLTINGKETKDMSLFEISKVVGTVLQDSDAQFVGMTVAEDIAFALENDCLGEPELHNRVMEVAKMVNINDYLKHAPGELSGGQKQRVSVAGVMVDDVDVLLFDEPLANLDPATGKRAIELIDEMQKQTGAAVIIIEHRLEDVLWRDVDRIVLMQAGRIVVDTDADALLSSDYLAKNGIREPLYITALKYAGVEISSAKKPHSIESVIIDENDATRVRDWFVSTKVSDTDEKPEVILETKKLCFSYPKVDKQVLNEIDVKVHKGEMVAIVGTNGAGKSTFSKVVCGFEDLSSGEILYKGKDFTKLSIKERAEYVGYVMQNPNQMISKVMIFDEVALGLKVRGVAEDEIDARVEKALKICGLWKFRNWPVSALSFGQKKRVTIASILVLDPEVIILDEPTAGQDFRHYTEIMEFLCELNALGITIIMVTHDMHLMLEYARRSVVFSKGRIIADMSCAKVLTDNEIISAANLKRTSLYDIAISCGIDNPTDFVRRFIEYERNCVRVRDEVKNAESV